MHHNPKTADICWKISFFNLSLKTCHIAIKAQMKNRKAVDVSELVVKKYFWKTVLNDEQTKVESVNCNYLSNHSSPKPI